MTLVVVGQEKARVGAFSEFVKLCVIYTKVRLNIRDPLFEALMVTISMCVKTNLFQCMVGCSPLGSLALLTSLNLSLSSPVFAREK